VLSFYKIFGYPTGLGALLVRKEALPHLRKSYFGGGTVAVSVAGADFFRYARCCTHTPTHTHTHTPTHTRARREKESGGEKGGERKDRDSEIFTPPTVVFCRS
jgi:selenocysteine lyase/cysteine desulfurase